MKAAFTFTAALLPLLARFTLVAATIQARDLHLKMHSNFGIKMLALDDDHLDKVGNSTFDQPIDHQDLGKGTFKQRYWWNAEFYEENGPVFLFNPGETSAENMLGYMTDKSLPGFYAKQLKGAVVILEHRYWGESVPYQKLTAETLQPLNLPNSIMDVVNFAKNVECEFCEGGTCNADENPWVLVGGSYSGALAAWTSQKMPGTFAAYHASSAVVQTVHSFWQYFSPVEEALPRDCSDRVKKVILHVDTILAQQDPDAVNKLKTQFNLQKLNTADFADTLADPFSAWQGDQGTTRKFCDHLASAGPAPAKTRRGYDAGLAATVEAYASWIRQNSGCGDGGANCNTYDPNIQWNTPDQVDDSRPWQWMLCNEPFGWYQVGPDASDGTNIVSAGLHADHYSRRCPLMFPEDNGAKVGTLQGWTEEDINDWTGGWLAPYDRVIFVNGRLDPWKSATLSSNYLPPGVIAAAGNPNAPVLVVEDGVHCPEFWIDHNNPNTWPVVQKAVETMRGWVGEWRPSGVGGLQSRIDYTEPGTSIITVSS